MDVNNLSVRSLQGLLLLVLDKSDDFTNNPNIKKMWKAINGMPHQLFAAFFLVREIYPEIKKKVFLQSEL